MNIAEPNALIGFAGPKVVKETIGKDLPDGFQTAEFLLKHGFVDRIVERKKLATEIGLLLSILLNKNTGVNSENNEQSTENTIPFTKAAS